MPNLQAAILAAAIGGLAPAKPIPVIVAPSAAAIGAEIRAKGPTEVVHRLYRSRIGGDQVSDWDRVMDQAGAGRADYIALFPRLAPGTDGETGEDLGIVLAEALPHAPSTVLAAISAKNTLYDVDRVCSAPFIEPTEQFMEAYVQSARAALAKVTASRLKTVKAACLAKLDTTAGRVAELPDQ